jgi:ribonuclease BN (tRNA processing enzyme)
MLTFFADDLNYRKLKGINAGITDVGMFSDVNVIELTGENEFELDGMKVSTAEGIHTMYNLAYKFEAGGQSVVVTGDTAYADDIIELSKEEDISVIDAHMAEGDFVENVLSNDEQRDNMRSAHMSNEDIAMTASKANIKKIIVTHLQPVALDAKAAVQAMRDAGFEGKIVYRRNRWKLFT